MNKEVDILVIDARIRKELSTTNEVVLKKRRNTLVGHLRVCSGNVGIVDKITAEVEKLDKLIKDIDEGHTLAFYISDTIQLIDKYRNLLKVPKRMSFMGKVCEPTDTNKHELVNKYLSISSKYSDVLDEKIEIDMKCMNCGSVLECEILDDCSYICGHCSSDQGSMVSVSSFTDSERVNISSKYSYDRRTHFRECIGQYQGTQNVTIPPDIYETLDKCFKFHSLLDGTPDTPRLERYARVTKSVILRFLKEQSVTKQYENINLIHSVVTGKPLPDISSIIDPMMEDFDVLSEIYDRKYADSTRKNFINTQYVLFQLLRRNGHDCDKDDFSNLKTVDRKFFHEEILKKVFFDLGWNYVSIF